MRLLRDDLREGLRARGPAVPRPGGGDGSRSGAGVEVLARAGATIALSGGGSVSLEPQGSGAELVRSCLLVQLLLAAAGGTARRLKVCADDGCPTAFFDRSRNCSRIWHDVTSCGNVANVRAHQKRARSTTSRAQPRPGSSADGIQGGH
nr:CGNR zinc finger domain-containing protein [Kineococcus aurantiacus]